MLSEAKHLYDYRRDPSLALRVTCKDIKVHKVSLLIDLVQGGLGSNAPQPILLQINNVPTYGTIEVSMLMVHGTTSPGNSPSCGVVW